MIRYLFVSLMFIHGLIHLMGFIRAFGYGVANQISGEISRFNGMFWLAATLLFMLASILFLLKNESWLWVAIPACIISQVLIIMLWKDAKFGTIANMIIIFAVIAVTTGNAINFIFKD